MTASTLRRAAAAVSLAVAVGLSAAACTTQPESIRSYNPSQGVNYDQGTAKLRNIAVVAQDASRGYLAGGVNSGIEDSIVGGNATLLNPDGSDAGVVTLTPPGGPIKVAANTVQLLQDSGIEVSGDLKPGQTVRLTLNFEHAGVASAVVPVLNSSMPDYAGVTPKTPSAAPRSGSATPGR